MWGECKLAHVFYIQYSYIGTKSVSKTLIIEILIKKYFLEYEVTSKLSPWYKE